MEAERGWVTHLVAETLELNFKAHPLTWHITISSSNETELARISGAFDNSPGL